MKNAVSLCCSLRQPIPCIFVNRQISLIPLCICDLSGTCRSMIQCSLPHGSVCMNVFMLYPQCSEMLLVSWWCKLWSVVWSNSKTISHSDPERHQVMHCQQPWSFLPFVTCGIEDVPLSFLNKNRVCCEIYPSLAFYVYLCDISFPHDVGPCNNNCSGTFFPWTFFPVEMRFMCRTSLRTRFLSGSRAEDHCCNSSCVVWLSLWPDIGNAFLQRA